jgi:hypothetical protein
LSDVAIDRSTTVKYNPEAIEKYSAKKMTEAQCLLFDRVLNGKINK